MSELSVTATRFKAECLGLLDDVAATGRPLVVTKYGKPVARVVPFEAPPPLAGSVTFNVPDEELVAPLGEPWDAVA